MPKLQDQDEEEEPSSKEEPQTHSEEAKETVAKTEPENESS